MTQAPGAPDEDTSGGFDRGGRGTATHEVAVEQVHAEDPAAPQRPSAPAPQRHTGAATLTAIVARLAVLNEQVRDAGEWVFDGGLHSPDAFTVVRPDGLVTDGPYVEGKEFIGGVWVIDVPDLDAARLARRAAEATTLPIEVRPFWTAPTTRPNRATCAAGERSCSRRSTGQTGT